MHCITMSVLLGQPHTQKATIKNQQKIITVVESMQHFSFAQSWHIPSPILGLTSLETKHGQSLGQLRG